MERSVSKKMGKNRKRGQSRPLWEALPFGLLAAAVSGMILALIGAWLAYRTENPTSLITAVSYFSLYTASLIGGFVAGKCTEQPGRFIAGLLTGALLSFLLAMIHIFLSGSPLPLWLTILLFLLVVLAGGIGGFVSGIRLPRRRKNRWG